MISNAHDHGPQVRRLREYGLGRCHRNVNRTKCVNIVFREFTAEGKKTQKLESILLNGNNVAIVKDVHIIE